MDSPERALTEYRRALKPADVVLIVEANRFNPLLYPHMTLGLGHEHVTRRRFHDLVAALKETERLERLPPFEQLLSYNLAVAYV